MLKIQTLFAFSSEQATRWFAVWAAILVTSVSLAQGNDASLAPYPQDTYPQPNSMGMFQRVLPGSFKLEPKDQLPSNKYFGLPFRHIIFNVLARTDSGTYHMAPKAVELLEDGTLNAFTWGGQEYAQGPAGFIPEPHQRLWKGPATQAMTADGKVQYSMNSAVGPEQVTYDGKSIEYVSADGAIAIKGTMVGNGTSWLYPWREPSGATNQMFYNVMAYEAEGQYYGEHVKGHLVIELMYGTTWYHQIKEGGPARGTWNWWVQNRGAHWSYFANRYDDGSSEMGQVMCGTYGFRGMVVTRQDGTASVNTTEVNAAMRDSGARYTLGNGEQWDLIADPKMSNLGPIRIGTIKRANEKRRIVSSMSAGIVGKCEQQ